VGTVPDNPLARGLCPGAGRSVPRPAPGAGCPCAGFALSVMQERSDCSINLNHESVIPLLGDLSFALTKAAKLVGKNARATGWFRRTTYHVVDLDTVVLDGQVIRSYTRFWGIFRGILIVLLGVLLFWILPVNYYQGLIAAVP
jgi:hypothetical protein